MGIDNCSDACYKGFRVPGITVLLILFSSFELKKKTNFYKKYNVEPFFLPYKKYFTEKITYVNKGCNLLNPYILTVLLSISFNKLPRLKL